VVLEKFSFAKFGLFLMLGAAVLHAAPRLVLTQTAFTVSTVPGSAGATQNLFAGNLGDGTLSLTATSSVTWLVPTVGASTTCSLKGPCIPIAIALQTTSLAAGTYTGTVTIADPSAVDAPQFVVVTVMVGGAVPNSIAFYLPPGESATQDFTTGSPVKATIAPTSPWLSIAVNGEGTFTFNVPYKVTATAAKNMATGQSTATITLSGSSFAPDNQSIAVTLNVTTDPILVATPDPVSLTGVQGQVVQTATIALSNSGQGTLAASGVTAQGIAPVPLPTGANPNWLSAQLATNGESVTITADPTTLPPGIYSGTVTIASNAANSSVVVPVQFTVEAEGPPVAYAGAAVNNGTFQQGQALAQGDIAAVFGDQLTLGALAYPSSGPPLPTTINGTQVFVNNTAAPLFFISGGQIDFEVPFEVSPGPATIHIVRNGQTGNMIYVDIAASAPRFLLLNGGPNAVITTPDTPPVVTGIPTHPAKAGDILIVYAIGMGQTSPAIKTGEAAPSKPLDNVPNVKACFGGDTPFSKADCFTPSFAGLSPTFVGLYQLNVVVPAGLPSGNSSFYFTVGSEPSNVVQIALQ
jgi:uncharacterized protein (TIGR03437 family)